MEHASSLSTDVLSTSACRFPHALFRSGCAESGYRGEILDVFIQHSYFCVFPGTGFLKHVPLKNLLQNEFWAIFPLFRSDLLLRLDINKHLSSKSRSRNTVANTAFRAC
jgi:hypothetical protein